jgi:hypothetical protein
LLRQSAAGPLAFPGCDNEGGRAHGPRV